MRRKDRMTPEKLDFVFPFVMFAYGAVMTGVLYSRWFHLHGDRLPSAVRQQMLSHKALSLLCLIGGGLWALQNLWL